MTRLAKSAMDISLRMLVRTLDILLSVYVYVPCSYTARILLAIV